MVCFHYLARGEGLHGCGRGMRLIIFVLKMAESGACLQGRPPAVCPAGPCPPLAQPWPRLTLAAPHSLLCRGLLPAGHALALHARRPRGHVPFTAPRALHPQSPLHLGPVESNM